MGPDFNLSSRGVHELVDTKIFSQKPGIVFMSATPRTKILCCDNNEELFRDVKVGEYQVQASLIDFTNFKQFHGGRFCVDMIFRFGLLAKSLQPCMTVSDDDDDDDADDT